MAQTPYVIVLAGNTREGRKYARRAGLAKGKHRVVHSAKQISGLRKAEVHELPGFAKRPDRHAINARLRFAKVERIQVTMPDEGSTPTPPDPRGQLTERQLEVAYRYHGLREARHEQWDAELEAKFAELSPEQLEAIDNLSIHVEDLTVENSGELPLVIPVLPTDAGWHTPGDPAEDFVATFGQDLADEVNQLSTPPTDQGDGLGEQLTIDGEQKPVEQPKRRRSRCKDCGELHFPEDPCATTPPEASKADDQEPSEPTIGSVPLTPQNFFGQG